MVSKILFHVVGAAHFLFGCYYDFAYVKFPSDSPMAKSSPSFGGKFKFLTYINAFMLTLYFTVALLNDLIGTNEPTPSQKPLIRRIRDTMFTALSFPVTMFVGITFWAIYALDRELILPRSMDAVFPSWLNHLMHTNIIVFILIELVTTFRMYPKRKVGLSILTTFMLSYVIWVHVIFFKTEKWVYPILAVLNLPVRIVFFVINLFIVWALYALGENLNKNVWSREIEESVRSGKKKAK